MGSLGTKLHLDCNVMSDAVDITPHIPSICAQNAILSLQIIRDSKVMGDAAKISPRIPSTCAQNTILSVLIIHIIRSCQISVAIDNPSLIPSVSCLTTSSYLWNDVCVASVSNGSSFGPGGYYRSAWQPSYPIKNRRFYKRTITLRPQILIREFSVWYVKYAALHGASFGRLRFSISLNLSKRQPKNLVFTAKMTLISKQLAEF
jgi:hypothetical protein